MSSDFLIQIRINRLYMGSLRQVFLVDMGNMRGISEEDTNIL